MTTWLIKKLSSQPNWFESLKTRASLAPGRTGFFLLMASLGLIYSSDRTLFDVIVETLSDAYLGVSVFVALTLAVFYFLEKHLKQDIFEALANKRIAQVPTAAILGALPGCGGAIIVVTRYVDGKLSFGALVAVLIATMGDAAFLLLAKEPNVALLVYGLSMISGTTFGWLVDLIHKDKRATQASTRFTETNFRAQPMPLQQVRAFMLLLIPGAIVGILELCRIDTNQFFGQWAHNEPTLWLGFIGTLLCLSLWMSQPVNSWSARFKSEEAKSPLVDRIAAETSFITICVAVAFLAYEVLIYFTNIDLKQQFSALGATAVLLAAIIGFIPGCGPQILVTSLYLNGVIPLSALVANSISNDGDALFPAIALAPKDAVKATLYSAIPAFLLGYLLFFSGF